MSTKKILTEKAPAPIGPYSQGILVDGKFLYTAGQGPMDPATGKIVDGGIKEQTRQVMKNLEAILEAGGTSLASVIKTTVFLKDMNDFAAMNKIYETFFEAPYPARTTVGISALPGGAHVEIEVVATAA